MFADSGTTYYDDYDYLRKHNMVQTVAESWIYQNNYQMMLKLVASPEYRQDEPWTAYQALFELVRDLPVDIRSRNISALIASTHGEDVVPICYGELQNKLPNDNITKMETNVLQIAFSHMPVPGESAAWEDILDFKQEEHDKQWSFRRFLLDLSVKKQSDSEIRDDFEWSMNEYEKFMKVHKLKTRETFLETYAIPALEIIENVAKLNLSKIAKGALSVRKRKIELMEAEMKAPGKECAYVFSARDRFGSS